MKLVTTSERFFDLLKEQERRRRDAEYLERRVRYWVAQYEESEARVERMEAAILSYLSGNATTEDLFAAMEDA